MFIKFFKPFGIAAAAALVLSGCAHFTKEQIAQANAERDAAIKEHNTVHAWIAKHDGKKFTNEDRTKYYKIAESCFGEGGSRYSRMPFSDKTGNDVYKRGTKFDTAAGKKTLSELSSSCGEMMSKLDKMQGGTGCYFTEMNVVSYQDGQNMITSPDNRGAWGQVRSAKEINFVPADTCDNMPKASEPIPAVLKSFTSDLKEFCPHVMKFRAQRWTNDVDKSTLPHRPYKYLELLCYKKT